MHVSVIICTWNRAKLLDQTLTEMHKLAIPPDLQWELIVVNNNCTDDTDAVIERHAAILPIRRLYEPTPGKSHAANRAIRESNGELLVWTDDDVLVDSNWLAAFCEAAEQFPDVMFFGGIAEPWFEVAPPRWIKRNLQKMHGVYAIRQFGPHPVDESQLPFGVSMAIRRNAFQFAKFDTKIGPIEDSQLRGEETDLIRRFMRQGLQGRWVPTSRLRHFIPANRLTYRYVWNFFVGLSRTDTRVQPVECDRWMLGWPAWPLRCYLKYSAKAGLLSVYRGRRWFRATQGAAWAKGIMEEMRSNAMQIALATGIPSEVGAAPPLPRRVPSVSTIEVTTSRHHSS
jgi:glycosyltransferase involved in cell wall biosynthesis